MKREEPTGARVWRSEKTGDYWIDVRLLPRQDIVTLKPEQAQRIMNAIQRCLFEIETEETDRQLGGILKSPKVERGR